MYNKYLTPKVLWYLPEFELRRQNKDIRGDTSDHVWF